jgi:hypothetical protein
MIHAALCIVDPPQEKNKLVVEADSINIAESLEVVNMD